MKKLTGHLYFWVILAILAGGLLGYLAPATAVSLKPLGDGFISLVKMLISPVIFCTVVLGIVGAGDMRKVGRVGGKALLYFEVVSTFALMIGLVVMDVLQPGKGFNADPKALDAKAVAEYAKKATDQSTVDFLLHVIPKTFTDAFTGSGDLLQVLLVAILFGYAMMHLGKAGQLLHKFIEECSHIFFSMMNTIMKLAPIGAGGAMAFTVLNTLGSLQSRRSYQHAMEEFIAWYCSEPRLALNRIVVLRYRMYLENIPLSPATINLRLAAVRRLAYEASDSGLLSPELVAGIRRVKGVKQLGHQVGNWLTVEEGQQLLGAVRTDTLRGKRDAAMLGLLLGCGLRRSEVANFEIERLQRRDGHWAVVRPGRKSRPRADGACAMLGQDCNRQLELRCQHWRR